MRAAVAQWYAKSLRAAHDHVRPEFPRRSEQGEAEQIRRHDGHGIVPMGVFNKSAEILNGAISRRILHQHRENFRIEFKRAVISDPRLNADRKSTRLNS